MLKDMGIIDVRDVARHVDMPDVKALADRSNAPRDLAELQISKALNDGVFMMPSAIQGAQGLDELIRIASEEYQRAFLSGRYPPKNIEALRRLILSAKARQTPPSAPASSPAAPGLEPTQSLGPPAAGIGSGPGAPINPSPVPVPPVPMPAPAVA
jgi:hypothetical protein